MDTLEAIATRRSVRQYTDRAVPKELIEKVIAAGLQAPSSMGQQKAIIVAVTNKDLIHRLSKMNAAIGGFTNDPIYGAPVCLIVLAPKEYGKAAYDGSLIMENLMLAAHALGLGSCWIHRAKEEFESDEGKEILRYIGIPDGYEGIGHCILGYSAGETPKAPAIKEHRVFWVE